MTDRCSISPADTGCSVGSPAQDPLHDPHSSEEELEVINKHNPRELELLPACPIRSTSVCLPEKRKWTQMSDSRSLDFNSENEETMENLENMSHFSNLSSRSMEMISPCSPFHSGKSQFDGSSPVVLEVSSDDEVPNLLESMATPVQFRTSPPLEAFKPGRPCKGRSLSPPHKVIHYEVSPRKRSRHARHSHVQRPCLDFEKMQQVSRLFLTKLLYFFPSRALQNNM